MANRRFNVFRALVAFLAALSVTRPASGAGAGAESFINFETIPVHPLDPTAVSVASVPVGIDPVSVRFRTASEIWVVNHLSDSISVVELSANLATARVVATIDTLDTPSDVVFAGLPVRAFVSCARPNVIQVFDPASRQLVTNLVIEAERPKALAVSPDGRTVYAGIFESGNGTTLVGGKFKNLLFIDNVVGLSNAPSAGQNPAFNADNSFSPPLNPNLPTNSPPPGSGLIVRKSAAGRWLDDQQRDWTEFVSGTNAHLTQRVPGWDLPDHDLAVIDADRLSIRYVSRLMNICMAVAPNPVSGRIAVVGTDARNEVRFEPNLNGTFARVNLALIDPADPSAATPVAPIVRDLNPHLNYANPTTTALDRERSLGDPRAIVWSADGSTAYVAGLGSRNVVVLDQDGARQRPAPIEVGEGPCGLVLDDTRHRLYVYHRFSSGVLIVDTVSEAVTHAIPLFDPTPLDVALGRRHLYDTRRTSGLGHVSCATCHVDARMDRLAWDLGNPAGNAATVQLNQQGVFVPNVFHPMKGAMLTQTLQDIIGHEPFHWRGDRADLAAFNPAFTDLQGRAEPLTETEMAEFKEFLASVQMPPNPFRALDNALPTSLPLPGHVASGLGVLPAGAQLPNGNALAGITAFNRSANFCNTCHTLPTGLGVDLPADGAHHFPVGSRLEGARRAKNAQFRNLADRLGMDGASTRSRAGFGFGHDGSVDSLTRFLVGLRVVDDQETADLIALLLSVAGSDALSPGAVADPTPPAAVGRQFTVRSPNRPAFYDSLIALARSATSRVDLVVKGMVNGHVRGWWFDRESDRFQADRAGEFLTPDGLLNTAGPGQELTFTVVARGTGRRLGIDRDLDGQLDRDEEDAGTNPADLRLVPEIKVDRTEIPVGADVVLTARFPPLLVAGAIAWLKDGVVIEGETNTVLRLDRVSVAEAGRYTVQVRSPFQVLASAPTTLQVLPLTLAITPDRVAVRQGSNAVFVATFAGEAPGAWQWQFNQTDLPGANAGTLTITNAQLASEGFYRLIAANAYGRTTSGPVRLDVLISPSVVIAPLSRAVTPGANATFAFQIAGHPPPFGFQLRRSTTLLTNYVTDRTTGFLTLFNVQAADVASYRIIVTNAANPFPGVSLGPVTISLLADFDHDGLPDVWETARGLNTNSSADANLDLDVDGLTNYQEYLAGTEPSNAQSVLRIERLATLPTGETVLQFSAVSNHTYAVQTRESLLNGSTGWKTVAEILAGPANRTISVTNRSAIETEGYFRVVTPRP